MINLNMKKNLLLRNIFLRIKKNNKIKNTLPIKSNFNSIIPLQIFQTWHCKNIPLKMANAINKIRKNNPRFKYFLFDDNDCREFIKNNYDSKILNAYDSLIPGAYKADLWRYCILFKNGGYYLDIKYEPFNNNIKFIYFSEKEHLVYDINNYDIYNAFMVCLPGNELLMKAINKIVENVENRFYGDHCLEPTGPKLLSKIITNNDKESIDMKHLVINGDFNQRIITYNGVTILKSYNGYLKEFDSHKKLVGDIRTAVSDHKKTQHLVDIFMIGMFLVVLMYTVVK